jgi:hypothetical protein
MLKVIYGANLNKSSVRRKYYFLHRRYFFVRYKVSFFTFLSKSIGIGIGYLVPIACSTTHNYLPMFKNKVK